MAEERDLIRQNHPTNTDETAWFCSYCNEENHTHKPDEKSIGVDDCKRCGTRRTR